MSRIESIFAGLTPEEIENIGYDYRRSYQGKFYPEMKELIANSGNMGLKSGF
ncbi:MAG: hypothetical protein R2744_08400 [Bacteroidales bacterium]